MLAERMTKMHAQIGRDVLCSAAGARSRRRATAFERSFKEASAAATAPEARDNYRLLRALWDEFRPAAEHAPSPEGARKLAERTEEVAWIAAKGARMLHEHARSTSGELVLSAGAARAAGQRLGKLHFLQGWALARGAAARDVKLAEGEIFLAIAKLRSAREGDEDLLAALAMAETQLALLRQSAERLDKGREPALQLEHIAKERRRDRGNDGPRGEAAGGGCVRRAAVARVGDVEDHAPVRRLRRARRAGTIRAVSRERSPRRSFRARSRSPRNARSPGARSSTPARRSSSWGMPSRPTCR
jgi:hypothetical protein